MKYFIFMVLLLASCKTIKKNQRISFAYLNFEKYGSKLHKAILYIPSKSKKREFETDVSYSKAAYYNYGDSSLIYLINGGVSTPADSLLRHQKGIAVKTILPDTISFSGMDGPNTYWREVKIDDLWYGYTRVPLEKKQLFDSALNTIKIKK